MQVASYLLFVNRLSSNDPLVGKLASYMDHHDQDSLGPFNGSYSGLGRLHVMIGGAPQIT
jgi:hypothetical protein